MLRLARNGVREVEGRAPLIEQYWPWPALVPKFVYGAVYVLARRRHVLISAAETRILPQRGPIDSECRVDRRLHVFGTDVAISRPAGVHRSRAEAIGRADSAATVNPRSRKQHRLLLEMV